MADIIQLNQEEIKSQLGDLVRQSVEDTLNAMLDAEADQITQAHRYERTEKRLDTRAGHYNRKLATKAGEVTLKVPKLRNLPFETAIIERYKRREEFTRNNQQSEPESLRSDRGLAKQDTRS